MDPWKSLPPDFVMALTCPPVPVPNSAGYPLDSTRNSWTFSRLAWSLKRLAFSPFATPGAESIMPDASTPSYLITFCSTARPENRMSPQVPVLAFCDPGACSMSCDIWRPLIGRFWTSRSLTLTRTLAELVSSTGDVATTVTDSDPPGGLSSKGSDNSWPTATASFEYSIGGNPCSVPRTVYVEGLSDATTK